MLNLDNTSVLTTSLDEITDKNLFAYCDNNPIMREDLGGDFWGELALAGGGTLGASWSIGGANFWNPIGWTILGVASVATVGIVGYKIYKAAKKKAGQDPYARPNQKKQGRERKNKSRSSDDWNDRGNKRNGPPKPKKHTPGNEHRKYK